MAEIKSKNPFDLLDNDSDSDSEKETSPAKPTDKTPARSGKRDAPRADTHAGGRAGRGGRRGGSDAVSRDKESSFPEDRRKVTDDGSRSDRPGGRQRGDRGGGDRGGRGRGRGGRDDRHSRSGMGNHQKQSDQGWGASTGEAEWKDEQAGEAIAQKESTQDPAATADAGSAPAEGASDPAAGTENAAPADQDAEAEAEDNNISYADYLAQQAEKRMEGLGLKEARKPNEGSKADNKKWGNAKAITRAQEGSYMQATSDKARRDRDRTRNAAQRVELDLSWKASERGDRGGRGRGEYRGGRGDRGGRGGGGSGGGEHHARGGDGERGEGGEGGYRGRGGGRGRGDGYRGRGEGEGGGYRGRGRGRGRGNNSDGLGSSLNDEQAFPSLGS